jgi:gamma-glutamylcyclotransferase (GGCT)/AIG2-like uncharacterized protein YtfP
MPNYLVFVYGSLKRGFRLFDHHLADCRFVGEATLPGYTIHKVEGAWYPGVQEGDGIVKGEVFEVDSDKLANLDVVEAEGKLYDRIIKDVIMDEDEFRVQVQLYVFRSKEKLGPVIQDGIWTDRS